MAASRSLFNAKINNMCRGISILKSRIRQELFEQYELSRLIHRRHESAEEELWFDYADRGVKQVILPVIHDGRLVIHEWGNRNSGGITRDSGGGKISKLPRTGWCKQESLDAGKWKWLHPEPVEIPANFGLEKGIWFQIIEGARGIVVHDESGVPRVYMLTQPASHYYQVMTRHDRMPVLIGQSI